MKKIALALTAVLMMVGPVVAESWDDRCAADAKLAALIMTQRQKGIPMSGQMKAIGNMPEASLYRKMVIDAYERPRYRTSEIVQREIEDFRDRWYLGCIKSDPSRKK
jgi:hypothetical protein